MSNSSGGGGVGSNGAAPPGQSPSHAGGGGGSGGGGGGGGSSNSHHGRVQRSISATQGNKRRNSTDAEKNSSVSGKRVKNNFSFLCFIAFDARRSQYTAKTNSVSKSFNPLKV